MFPVRLFMFSVDTDTQGCLHEDIPENCPGTLISSNPKKCYSGKFAFSGGIGDSVLFIKKIKLEVTAQFQSSAVST